MLFPINIGDVVAGRYVVESTLGKGGMGMVFAARHIELDHRVAIKVLREGVLGSDEAHARFLQEARALARFQSEHLVRVFDVGRLASGTPYMVMEYLDGADVATVLRERGTLEVSEAVDYVVQACAGLAEAHAAGVIHRDLKPGNLFLAPRLDGTQLIKVIDFGIAKSLASQATFTRDSVVLGSPTYMSPEQLKSARDVDARTDVWALGVILYKLLTSSAPFQFDDFSAYLRAIRASDPPSVRDRRADVPEGLDRAIMGCLCADREARTQTVTQLASEITPYGTAESRECCARILRISARPTADSRGASSEPVAPASSPPASDSSTRREGAGALRLPSAARVPTISLGHISRSSLPATLPEFETNDTPMPSRVSTKTMEATIPAAPVLDAGSVPPAFDAAQTSRPPARSGNQIWVFAGLTAIGVLLAVSLVTVVTGHVTSIGYVAAVSEVSSAPLPTVARDRADAVDLYPAVAQLARRIAPSAQLEEIEVGDNTRGLVDLASGGRARFVFEYAEREGQQESGTIEVVVTAAGLEGTRRMVAGSGVAVQAPRCPVAKVWQAAEASGLRPDAIATLHYGASRGVSSWVIEVPNRPEWRREIDGITCQVLKRGP